MLEVILPTINIVLPIFPEIISGAVMKSVDPSNLTTGFPLTTGVLNNG